MKKYHTNIDLTVEVSPSKYLNTKIYRDNSEIKCFVYHKEMKLPLKLSEKFIKSNKRGAGFLLFLRPKFGYLLQKLPTNVFYELLEEKIVENKKAKFSHAKQIFFTFFRNTNEYEY